MKNISVPDNISQHGGLICLPIKWHQLVVFYFVNYLAYAGSVFTEPGAPLLDVIFTSLTALFLPYSGIREGVYAILYSPLFQGGFSHNSDLQAAAEARALCIIIRSPTWSVYNDSWLEHVRVDSMSEPGSDRGSSQRVFSFSRPEELRELGIQKIPPGSRIVHGLPPHLPDDYMVALLPRDASVRINNQHETKSYYRPHDFHGYNRDYPAFDEKYANATVDTNTPTTKHCQGLRNATATIAIGLPELLRNHWAAKSHKTCLSSYRSIPKGLAAIIQVFFASFTLYRTRGDQLHRYGYASFGLTVVQYLLMSITNFFANILAPNYPALYLVRSKEMYEAESRGISFDCVVGTLEYEEAFNTRNGWFAGTAHLDNNTQEFFTFQTEPKEESSQEHSDTGSHGSPTWTIEHQTQALNPSFNIPECSPFKRNKVSISKLWIFRVVFLVVLEILLFATPFIVMGTLTSFEKRQSTTAQRVWTMMWLVISMAFGWEANLNRKRYRELALEVFGVDKRIRSRRSDVEDDHSNVLPGYSPTKYDHLFSHIGAFGLIAVWYVPAIGGLVVVGQMLHSYGYCYLLSE